MDFQGSSTGDKESKSNAFAKELENSRRRHDRECITRALQFLGGGALGDTNRWNSCDLRRVSDKAVAADLSGVGREKAQAARVPGELVVSGKPPPPGTTNPHFSVIVK